MVGLAGKPGHYEWLHAALVLTVFNSGNSDEWELRLAGQVSTDSTKDDQAQEAQH